VGFVAENSLAGRGKESMAPKEPNAEYTLSSGSMYSAKPGVNFSKCQ
jgi:hypothetical protein